MLGPGLGACISVGVGDVEGPTPKGSLCLRLRFGADRRLGVPASAALTMVYLDGETAEPVGVLGEGGVEALEQAASESAWPERLRVHRRTGQTLLLLHFEEERSVARKMAGRDEG